MYLLTGMSRNAHRVLPKFGKPTMIMVIQMHLTEQKNTARLRIRMIIVWYVPIAISSGSSQFGNL